MSFTTFGLRPELLKALDALNFHQPTPIQEQAIPHVLQGKDVLASAQTGTGKTLAFVLPVLHRMLDNPRAGVGALILLPTRELAAQVASVIKEVGKFAGAKSALLVGGESFHMQLQALRSGATLVIATPGRLIDHLERRTVRLEQVHTLILDEADRMLDMGFAPAIQKILRYLPAQRQTMLFSATLPADVARLGHLALKDPAIVRIAPDTRTADTVAQFLYPVMHSQKSDLLLAILRSTAIQSVLIFTRTKRGADHLARFLKTQDFSVVAMHADLTQSQRNHALQNFKNGKVQIMVATDIAARGLDVKKLGHVVNFDVPEKAEDYVHRIGRTGRHFEVGDAYTMATPQDEHSIHNIERFIGRKLPRVQVPDFPYEPLPPPVRPKTFAERFKSGRRFIPRGRNSRFGR